MNSKLRVVFFGTPDFVIPILQTLIDNFEVVGVVSAPDSIQGRKKILTPSPVKKFALEQNIPILQPNELTTENRQQKTDLFVVAAYGKIIPQKILDIPKNGALNIHPSLLPKYRGPSPIQSAILNGETKSGITIIKMDDKMDHGPIVSQWEYPLNKEDTFESLHVAMFKDAAKRLPDVINNFITENISTQTQSEDDATFCKMITKETGFFDSNNPPQPYVLDRMIRALYPWPTAHTKLKIHNSEFRNVKFLPGRMIQIEGGKPMGIKDAINGYPELRERLEQLLPLEQ